MTRKTKIIYILSFSILVALITSLFIFVFSQKRYSIDAENFGKSESILIDDLGLEGLIEGKKSFILFVDQSGCITAEGLKKLIGSVSTEKSLTYYQIMFADLRKTSFYDNIKYYPSVAIVSKGKLVSWLKADADEDTERYKNLDAFKSWLDNYIIWN